MVEPGVTENIANRAAHPGLVIPGAKDDAFEAGEDDGTGTHRAGLQSDVEGAIVEAPLPQRLTRGPNGEQFGVRRGVLVANRPVSRFRDDFAVPDD